MNRINAVFDVWIDVQRRWVYLDGIFGGSADIKLLLPNETQKFQKVSSEFLNLMKIVAKSPLVLEVLNIQDIQKTLERLADLWQKYKRLLVNTWSERGLPFPGFTLLVTRTCLKLLATQKMCHGCKNTLKKCSPVSNRFC